MENLLLTVNIVFPIFLVMAVGYFCRHSGMLNAEDIVAMNRVSFGVFLPASLCHSLLEVEAGAAVSPGRAGIRVCRHAPWCFWLAFSDRSAL